MISTTQLAPRTPAAPLVGQGFASDASVTDSLASDTFSDVLERLTAGPAALPPVDGLDRLAISNAAPTLSVAVAGLRVQVPAGRVRDALPSGPHHRHSAPAKSAEATLQQTSASALLVVPDEAGVPTVPDKEGRAPKQRESARGKTADDPIGVSAQTLANPVSVMDQNPPALPSLDDTSSLNQVRQVPALTPPPAVAVPLAAPQASPASSSNAARLWPGPHPLIANSAKPIASASSADRAPQSAQVTPGRTAEGAPIPGPARISFAAPQQKPDGSAAVPPKAGRAPEEPAAFHSLSSRAGEAAGHAEADRPAPAQPATPSAAAQVTLRSNRFEMRVDPRSTAGAPGLTGPAARQGAVKMTTPGGEPLTPQSPSALAILQSASGPASQQGVTAVAVPRTQLATAVPQMPASMPGTIFRITQSQPQTAELEGSAGLGSRSSDLAAISNGQPLRSFALMPDGNPSQPAHAGAVAPLPIAQHTQTIGRLLPLSTTAVTPKPTQITPAEQSVTLQAPVWQASAQPVGVVPDGAHPELVLPARMSVIVPILTPAQASSRFQTMLDQAAKEGLAVADHTRTQSAKLVEPVARRDVVAPVSLPQDKIPVATAAQAIVPLRAVPERTGPPAPMIDQPDAAPSILPQEKGPLSDEGRLVMSPGLLVADLLPLQTGRILASLPIAGQGPKPVVVETSAQDQITPALPGVRLDEAAVARRISVPTGEAGRQANMHVIKPLADVSLGAAARPAVVTPENATLPTLDLPVAKASPRAERPVPASNRDQPVVAGPTLTEPVPAGPRAADPNRGDALAPRRLAAEHVEVGPAAPARPAGEADAAVRAMVQPIKADPILTATVAKPPMAALQTPQASPATGVLTAHLTPTLATPIAPVPATSVTTAPTPAASITAHHSTNFLAAAGPLATATPVALTPVAAQTGPMAAVFSSAAGLLETLGRPLPASDATGKPIHLVIAASTRPNGALNAPTLPSGQSYSQSLVPAAAQGKAHRQGPLGAGDNRASPSTPPAGQSMTPSAGAYAGLPDGQRAQPTAAAAPALAAAAGRPVAVTASVLHGSVAGDHAHHILPRGFSTTLAHSVAESGHSRAELILQPAELGRLRFDLVTQGDQVQVTLAAERPETLDLLRRHADELRQEFKASGLDAGTLSFGQWGNRGEQHAAPDPQGFDVAAEATPSLPPVTRSAPRLPVSGSGLDLRL